MDEILEVKEEEEEEKAFLSECQSLAKEIRNYDFKYLAGAATLVRALLRARMRYYLHDVLVDIRAIVESLESDKEDR